MKVGTPGGRGNPPSRGRKKSPRLYLFLRRIALRIYIYLEIPDFQRQILQLQNIHRLINQSQEPGRLNLSEFEDLG